MIYELTAPQQAVPHAASRTRQLISVKFLTYDGILSQINRECLTQKISYPGRTVSLKQQLFWCNKTGSLINFRFRKFRRNSRPPFAPTFLPQGISKRKYATIRKSVSYRNTRCELLRSHLAPSLRATRMHTAPSCLCLFLFVSS